MFAGLEMVLEESIVTDYALVHNFNPPGAMSGQIMVVEAERVVEVGGLHPDDIHLPDIFVQRVVERSPQQAARKVIEKRTTRRTGDRPMSWTRDQMAARAAAELGDGDYVNLGIGLPTMIPDFLDEGSGITLHAENGIPRGRAIPARRRGGPGSDQRRQANRVGARRVILRLHDAPGDLANWMVPGSMIMGIGGAMDLVGGAGRVMLLMDRMTKGGEAKLVSECTLPLTGRGVVDRVITDLGVFDVTGTEFEVIELAPASMRTM